VDRGASPRRCRVVCVRFARQGLPEEGGGVGDVAGSRQTCLPAIGVATAGQREGGRGRRAGGVRKGEGAGQRPSGQADQAKRKERWRSPKISLCTGPYVSVHDKEVGCSSWALGGVLESAEVPLVVCERG
jgi:hypothetical protein